MDIMCMAPLLWYTSVLFTLKKTKCLPTTFLFFDTLKPTTLKLGGSIKKSSTLPYLVPLSLDIISNLENKYK